MGKDYYGYHGVSKATAASGSNGKRTGGGSGKPLGGGGTTGGRDYYGYLGVNKASTAGTIRKQPEKNPRGNKEAERRYEQSSRSYKVLHDPPRRPFYDKHRRAEEKPKGKLPLPAMSDADWGGVGEFFTGGPWLMRERGEENARDGEKDYGVTDDEESTEDR